MGALDGKVAIVTGAGKGLGKYEAIALAKEGAAVALVARTYEAADKVAKEIAAFGGKALPVACDVTKAGQVEKAVEETVKAFGTIDILVNGAQYIARNQPLLEWTENEMRATWESGVLGTYHVLPPASEKRTEPTTIKTDDGFPISLSAREIEVLSLIAQGKSNQEISAQLFLALNTVKRHAYNIYAKLEVKKRTHAVWKARQLGLIP